jgi:hypothetical protein
LSQSQEISPINGNVIPAILQIDAIDTKLIILTPGGNVGMVKLGDAREIDGLILRYRDLACDANLPSFGARPNSSSQPPKSALEVEEISLAKPLQVNYCSIRSSCDSMQMLNFSLAIVRLKLFY